MPVSKDIIIFTDGAYLGNLCPGGFRSTKLSIHHKS